MEERLQKILARAGFGSRRACETIITAGRVRVNGRAAGLGDKADASSDTITVDGSLLPKAEPLVYIALNKPRGVLSTVSDPLGRPTVRGMIGLSGTLYPVGRLDEDSEGLILLTNDGEMANRLTHPKYGHEKEYRVLVASHPDPRQLEAWRHGIVLEDGHKTAPAQVFPEEIVGKGSWITVVMREGRKRQIRETGDRIGLPVVRILRVRIGSLKLGGLKPGEWRLLSPAEISALKKNAEPGSRPAARSHPSHSERPGRSEQPEHRYTPDRPGAARSGERRENTRRSSYSRRDDRPSDHASRPPVRKPRPQSAVKKPKSKI